MAKPDSRRKRIAFGVVLALLMTTLLVGACEMLIRVTHPEWAEPRLRLSQEIVHDPALGWAGQPGFEGKVGPEQVTIRINAQGFRDEDFEEKLRRSEADGLTRILFVGDSLTYGYKIEEWERLSEQLEAMEAARGAPVETFNVGMPGYGTGQELRAMEEMMPRIRPQVVVLLYCTNDIGDAALPYDFRLAHRVYKPFYNLDGQLVFNRTAPVRFSHRVHDTWMGNLELCYFIDWLGYRMEDFAHVRDVHLWNSPLIEDHPALTREQREKFIHNLGAMTKLEGMRPYYDINKRRNFALWRQMGGLCRASGARLIMLFDQRDAPATTAEIIAALSAEGQEVLTYGEPLDPYRPWGGVWGDGHPNAVQNFVVAMQVIDRLDQTETPIDFAGASWIDTVPDHLDLRRPHPRRLLFGNWGRFAKTGREAGPNSYCMLRPPTTDGPVAVTVSGHGKPAQDGTPAHIRIWCGNAMIQEADCNEDAHFDLQARVPAGQPGLLFLRIEAVPDVFIEKIGAHPVDESETPR